MIKTTEDRSARIDEGHEHHDFGVADLKSRTVGSVVYFQVQTYIEAPADARTYCTNRRAGTYFAWMGSATRAGKEFGAGQNWNLCKTEAERIAQVEKYLKGAKARALKSFA